MSIAIVGAGMVGCCAALELAARGKRVDLFDSAAAPLTGASRWNEGKIHLGYVYAKDDSLRTARALLSGSLVFARHVERLLGQSIGAHVAPNTLVYAVPRDTMVPAEQIGSYFGRVDSLIAGMLADPQHDYFGARSLPPCEPLRVERHFDPERIVKAYACPELSIDARAVGDLVAGRVLSDPRIAFHADAAVASVERSDRDKFVLHLTDGRCIGAFDQVINASWQSRMAIDQTLGYRPHRRWLHRYKAGVSLRECHGVQVPSVTFVLGPFGDVVSFGGGVLYLSWYPAGCLAMSSEVLPPDCSILRDPQMRMTVARATLSALSALVPDLAQVEPDPARMDVHGGWIFAWGSSDIDRADSELHERDDVGVFSDRGYHSVNTDKYGMAPLLAMMVCDRITA